MNQLVGKTLIFLGMFLIMFGVLFLIGEKLPFKFLGKLPGDIRIERQNFKFYFPLATCIVLSILLTIIFNLILRR